MGSNRRRPGATLGLGPPVGESWVWMTNVMLSSITMRALSIHATRILAFLMARHSETAGRRNGRLVASYRQLKAWGLTGADVRKGLEELYVTGFVRLTHQGLRVAGGGDASEYALTWLPTMAGLAEGLPPTHDWQKVLKKLEVQRVGSVAAAKVWLKQECAAASRGAQRRAKLTARPQLKVV